MYPILVDGVWVDRMGRPWKPAKPYPGRKPGGIASSASAKAVQKLDPEEAYRRTKKSRVYWAAYQIAQKEKIELMGYNPPGWYGARKRERKRRQWLPGEHKKPG